MKTRLTAHLAQVRTQKLVLERGLETGRAGMIRRFALFAVAGVAADVAPPADSGSTFMLAYLVAARLKDQLEAAGFRFVAQKTLISLYLNAIGCERRRSKDRFLADPAASVIATAIGFISAKELHRAIYDLHQVRLGAGAVDRLEQMRFDRSPCEAFDLAYLAPKTPEDAIRNIQRRARLRF